jgi:hypothetical protein
MKKITYKNLQKFVDASFQQLVRFANGLYGQDPEAPRSGGVARSFDADEVFDLFLMARLVGQFRFEIKEAAELVHRIAQEMEGMGLLPSQRLQCEEPLPRITLRVHRGPALEFRIYDFAELQVHYKQETRPDGLLSTIVRVNEGPYTVRFWPENALSLTADPHYPAAAQSPLAEIHLTDDLTYVLASLRGSIF